MLEKDEADGSEARVRHADEDMQILSDGGHAAQSPGLSSESDS